VCSLGFFPTQIVKSGYNVQELTSRDLHSLLVGPGRASNFPDLRAAAAPAFAKARRCCRASDKITPVPTERAASGWLS
jgi:hypothetical protein